MNRKSPSSKDFRVTTPVLSDPCLEGHYMYALYEIMHVVYEIMHVVYEIMLHYIK